MTALRDRDLGGLPWSSIGALFGPAALLLAIDGRGGLWGPAALCGWLGLGALAAAAAFVLDDPAAEVTLATPTRWQRRVVRRLTFVGLLAVVWLGYCWQATRTEPALDPRALALSGLGVLVVTMGSAAVCRRLGVAEPGTVLAPAAAALVLVAFLAPSLPGHVRLLLTSTPTVRDILVWALLLGTAVSAMYWGSRDPWRGSQRRRRGARSMGAKPS